MATPQTRGVAMPPDLGLFGIEIDCDTDTDTDFKSVGKKTKKVSNANMVQFFTGGMRYNGGQGV